MKARQISETQRLRALSVGITPVLIQNTDFVELAEPLPESFRTSLGCTVETVVLLHPEYGTDTQITLSCAS